jgi:Lipid A 3-O-deacylase (PagL)
MAARCDVWADGFGRVDPYVVHGLAVGLEASLADRRFAVVDRILGDLARTLVRGTNWRHSDLTWTTQFSTTPSLRLAEGWRPRWYAEFGVGPSLLLPLYVTRERTFSTEFNFETHLALGRLVGAHGQHDFSVRVDHYSNAGLAQPNPGVSLVAIRYTLHFGRSATPVFALPHAAAAYDFDRPAADYPDRPTASALTHTGAGDGPCATSMETGEPCRSR